MARSFNVIRNFLGRMHFATLGLLVLVCASCRPVVGGQPIENDAVTISKPDELPYENVRLVLAGEVIQAKLLRDKKPDATVFTIVRDGSVLEREVYSTVGTTFRLNEIAGVSYDPPVPLVFEPIVLGDTWNWKGTVKSGIQSLPASCSLHASSESLNVAGGPFSSVKIQMKLGMMVDGANAERMLTFWFVNDRGLVKREVGAASAREPQ